MSLWQAKLDLHLFRLRLAHNPELFDDKVVHILYRNDLTDARTNRVRKRVVNVKIVAPKPLPESPYLDARQAAAYLGLAYSTFRKRRKFISASLRRGSSAGKTWTPTPRP